MLEERNLEDYIQEDIIIFPEDYVVCEDVQQDEKVILKQTLNKNGGDL